MNMQKAIEEGRRQGFASLSWICLIPALFIRLNDINAHRVIVKTRYLIDYFPKAGFFGTDAPDAAVLGHFVEVTTNGWLGFLDFFG